MGGNSVSNHQPHDCLFKRLFRRRSKKTSKLRVTDLCAGNSAGTGEFPAQIASNAENVSIWWRHHARDVKSYGISQRKYSVLQLANNLTVVLTKLELTYICWHPGWQYNGYLEYWSLHNRIKLDTIIYHQTKSFISFYGTKKHERKNDINAQFTNSHHSEPKMYSSGFV